MTTSIDNVYSVEDIKSANRIAGYTWFSPTNMRLFKSRILDGVYKIPSEGLVLFVSSEKGPDNVRTYAVKAFEVASGYIMDARTDFERYATVTEAKKDAKKMMENNSTSLDNL